MVRNRIVGVNIERAIDGSAGFILLISSFGYMHSK